MHSPESASRTIQFVQSLYEASGFTLPDWQSQDILSPLYGTVDADDYRQYLWAYISIPRRNGKTILSAALALKGLLSDNEPNPEVYIVAPTLDNTKEAFRAMVQMIESHPQLSKLLSAGDLRIYNTPNRKEILYSRNNGFIQALTSGGKTKHGKGPSLVLFDELHQMNDLEMWRAMTSGSAHRKQPLFLITTTAGEDTSGLCYDQYRRAKKVRNGTLKDTTYFVYLLEADSKKDDWTSPEVWRKVNPSLRNGHLNDKIVQAEFTTAQTSALEEAKFKRLRLNMWVSHTETFLNIQKWNEQKESINDADLVGKVCFAALDLSSRKDLTALVLLFPFQYEDGTLKYVVKPYFWTPEDTLQDRMRSHNVPYDLWVEEGLLYTCPGLRIDYNQVFEKLCELSATYTIAEIAYDDWNSASIIKQLSDAGYTTVEYRQGAKSFNLPLKELEVLVLEKLLVHGNHPVLTFQANNLSVKEDLNNNVQPKKRGNKNSKYSIDGMVALTMALGRAMRHNQVSVAHDAHTVNQLKYFLGEADT